MGRLEGIPMNVLITGANGFVGKNLQVKLNEENINFDVYLRDNSVEELHDKLLSSDFVIHLAGVNRPISEEEFDVGNRDLTQKLCDILREKNKKIPIIYSSSIQAEVENPYGISKKLAEDALLSLQEKQGNQVLIYRLPNVFGKWCKPNYNSAVATFCHNIANDLPIHINDPNALIDLVYIDDVINEFVSVIKSYEENENFKEPRVRPVYQITVGDLERQLKLFRQSKETSVIEAVGVGLTRALYSTYISYYRPEQFNYSLKKHTDSRGMFVEMLKTKDSGQFSFFTAHPGVTRGGHYHHTKNEKFLVIKGKARFGFRQIDSGESYSIETCGEEPQVVETVPGWSHDITNIGNEEMFVMLWANEIFDPENPDTVYHKV